MSIKIIKNKLNILGNQVFANILSSAKAAVAYFKQGLSPAPLIPKSKIPSVKLKEYEFTPDGSLKDFGPSNGVALRLGPDHGGLSDVDLDTMNFYQLHWRFKFPAGSKVR